ncbi:flagellar basal body rod protein FlgC [Rickettsiales endosymbiont of Stachyamoeba lipophora]|uniref:flagellar basal body rod protein FlgC n=1 Tax=Rickettsiales endosymbiont of Stachyamoeba lipophora TaxID=2486578 RepID=UPI000F64AC34|nr:flagellar basal body rod protein FlgC [Rickettsiales endosymbiont of Stachyamoeba lipophora]AZL15302.1 flagellar basal body rod protein FlgC [Rickettsiales endosymbiont of Stachyamoeba lipophora]
MSKIVYLLFCLVLHSLSASAGNGGLLDSLEISAAGMKVQSKRMSIVSQNMANADATGILPGETPYQRKIIFFKLKPDRKTGIDLVQVYKISKDQSDFQVKFDPKHPAADSRGYVLYPNVDRLVETMDAKEAQRSYEANMNALEISKSMVKQTLDILR